MPPIRLLLVDDHRIVRQGIRSLLEMEADLQVIGEADSGTRALGLIETLAPDVVLLDIKMPDIDGVEVCRRTTARHPELPVIILTAFSADDKVLECIRAGAKGYVLKDVDVVELARTIRAVHHGESVLDSKIVAAVLSEVRRQPEQRKSEPAFSEREIQVVQFMSRGMTNREIGRQLYLSTSTIKVEVRKIADKLGVTTRTEVIYEASKKGLI